MLPVVAIPAQNHQFGLSFVPQVIDDVMDIQAPTAIPAAFVATVSRAFQRDLAHPAPMPGPQVELAVPNPARKHPL